MKISFKSIVIGEHTGYGNASRLLVEALGDQGVEVCPDSSILVNFCMPPDYEVSDITIGYTPWESTEVPKNWILPMRGVNELWTTSSWVADVYEKYVDKRPIVIPHGIEPCWKPVKHSRALPFTFLHVGEPAVRKGGDIVLQAWYKAFRDRSGIRLVYKCVKYPTARVKDSKRHILASPESMSNVDVIGNVYTQQQMHDLFSRVQCMVYPSRGEGFGLIPFEAMASGLPTIVPAHGGTSDFASLSPLQLHNDVWVPSHQKIHPGLWMDHDVDEVIELMERAIEKYEGISEMAYENAKKLHQEWSWERVAVLIKDRLDALT